MIKIEITVIIVLMESLLSTVPTPSSFLITVISIFTMFFFLKYLFAFYLNFARTESVPQKNQWLGNKNCQKNTHFLWPTNESFIALTQCNKLILRKWQKNAKKKKWSKLTFTVTRKSDSLKNPQSAKLEVPI